MLSKIKTVTRQNFDNRMKAIETRNLKKYKTSFTWISLFNKFRDCIIEIDEKTITFDEKKYKEILKGVQNESIK